MYVHTRVLSSSETTVLYSTEPIFSNVFFKPFFLFSCLYLHTGVLSASETTVLYSTEPIFETCVLFCLCLYVHTGVLSASETTVLYSTEPIWAAAFANVVLGNVCIQKSSVFYQKSRKFYQDIPLFCQNSSIFYKESSVFCKRLSVVWAAAFVNVFLGNGVYNLSEEPCILATKSYILLWGGYDE